eukprot:gene12123-biopygen2276
MSITTDGEAANIGCNSGLWKRLSDQCNRNILTFWCCAHRSDLAVESIIQTVPELKIWKSSLTGVAKYFRTSIENTKMLKQVKQDAKQFPRHHEVRFAEHFLQLVEAILANMTACKEVWNELKVNGDRNEKAEASGFLKTWDEKHIWLRSLMGDTLEIFTVLQQINLADDSLQAME